MGETRVNRRLAAIVAADVCGYSRLMGADEAGTVAILRAHSTELINPAIERNCGRVVKTTGDGLLAEFASVVDAVQCAVEIQRGMSERNVAVAEDRRILVRIGINLGDVIVEDGDIYGDGVNLAARLESLAPPGGILVSRAAHDQVHDKLKLRFQDLGDQTVKNIARPVRVFAVDLADQAPAAPARAPAPAVPDRPSIVVLAFQNMSGDPEQEYFSDGIADDIITDLSKISALFVIARNSAFAYKGKSVDLRSLSRELGVRYVLEGSVRKAANRVRVSAQLIDGTSGGHIWAERYDRDLTDIFAVQDELTREIVGALSVKLSKTEKQRLERRPTDNLEAYDQFLRGRENFWLHTHAAIAEARARLEKAIELDPHFALAHAYLAMTLHIDTLDRLNAWSDQSLELSHAHARRAVELDNAEPQARCALASVELWRRNHANAMAEAERSIALAPNYAQGYLMLGWVLLYSGEAQNALEQFEKAMRLDPHHPDIFLHFVGQALFQLGRYEDAIAVAKQRIARNPNTDITHVLLAASHGHLSQPEPARAAWAEVLRINPDYSLEHRRRVLPFKHPRDFEQIVEGLRKAGLAV